MLVQHFRKMARNNAWANHRLLNACAQLSAEEFAAMRTSFFPSLNETMNHILLIDLYYLEALEEGARGYDYYSRWTPHMTFGSLAEEQRAIDRRLIAFCDRLEPDDLTRTIVIDRGPNGPDEETIADTLAHLFQHQIHHRGQAHAMLAGTAVPPPQLDEYFLAYDAQRRAADLRELGIEGPEAII